MLSLGLLKYYVLLFVAAFSVTTYLAFETLNKTLSREARHVTWPSGLAAAGSKRRSSNPRSIADDPRSANQSSASGRQRRDILEVLREHVNDSARALLGLNPVRHKLAELLDKSRVNERRPNATKKVKLKAALNIRRKMAWDQADAAGRASRMRKREEIRQILRRENPEDFMRKKREHLRNVAMNRRAEILSEKRHRTRRSAGERRSKEAYKMELERLEAKILQRNKSQDVDLGERELKKNQLGDESVGTVEKERARRRLKRSTVDEQTKSSETGFGELRANETEIQSKGNKSLDSVERERVRRRRRRRKRRSVDKIVAGSDWVDVADLRASVQKKRNAAAAGTKIYPEGTGYAEYMYAKFMRKLHLYWNESIEVSDSAFGAHIVRTWVVFGVTNYCICYYCCCLASCKFAIRTGYLRVRYRCCIYLDQFCCCRGDEAYLYREVEFFFLMADIGPPTWQQYQTLKAAILGGPQDQAIMAMQLSQMKSKK